MKPVVAEIASAILEARKGYLKRGMSLFDIGNGYCYEFAEEVMDRVFGEAWRFHEGQHGWQTLESEQLYLPPKGSSCTIGAETWDWDLLEKHWSIAVPNWDRARHDALVPQGPSHCWIFFDGRHYDCEHPEGVKSFFELNFFRRWLENTGGDGNASGPACRPISSRNVSMAG